MKRERQQRKEALERERATSEILRAIAESQTDAQPVFDTIVRNAVKLCGGMFANAYRYDGEQLHIVASTHKSVELQKILADFYPARPNERQAAGRAILAKATVKIEDALADPAYDHRFATTGSWRRVLAVPMLRRGEPIGVIAVVWAKPGPVSTRQEQLLKTFADQAVIAIENVRLFTETKEALDRQTATTNILSVISSSPTDLAPVFDAILGNATALCDAHLGVLNLYDGEELWTVAHRGTNPEFEKWVFERGRFKPEAFLTGLAAERGPVHIADIRNTPSYREGKLNAVKMADIAGARTFLAVPLLKESRVIGAISIYRPEVRLFTDKQIALVSTFADQAVIAIENVRLFNETKEALDRQTATSEILRVISQSPTDTQPVFKTIVASAARLCDADFSAVARFEGGLLHLVAVNNMSPAETAAYHTVFPRAPGRNFAMGRAFVDGRPVHIENIETDPDYDPWTREVLSRGAAYRTFLGVPILQNGLPIGAIGCGRHEMKPFTAPQIELVKTFADQAVIAIENVRLFNETKEALKRQTATADILKVISSSPTTTQPVFESIVQKCHALYQDSRVALLLIDDGKLITRASTDDAFEPVPIDRESGLGACVLEARTIHLPDLQAAAEQYPRLRQLGLKHGYRSGMFAPLLREGRSIGGISVLRRQSGAFSDKDVALLTTFADQAVIAIENARLFNETKEALEQQTATSEVLKTISRSTFDLNAVLEVLIENATRLAGANQGFIFRFDGERARLAYSFNAAPTYRGLIEANPIPPTRGSAVGRVLLERKPVHIPDVLADPEFTFHEAQRAGGFRSMLGVPMLREGNLIGVIAMWSTEVKPFTQKQMELVSTFADQAVIAIENVRLFNETKEALERQTATAEILAVISSNPTDTTPVFDAIVRSALRLFEGLGVGIALKEGNEIRIVAEGGGGVFRADPGNVRPLDRDSLAGRVIGDGQVVSIADTEAADAPRRTRERARELGYRAITGAPMRRAGVAIGSLAVMRKEPGALSEKQLQLLQAFADQAVIALENARLFNELQATNANLRETLEQQTATSDILRVISSSPTDTQPVFDAIASNAARLSEADSMGVFRVEGNELRMVAHFGRAAHTPKARSVGDTFALTRGSLVGRALLDRRTVHVHDLAAEPDEEWPEAKWVQRAIGHRTALAIPLMREGVGIGAIFTRRMEVRPFSDKHIALLQTFADQAVIAIENVRLFNETKEALERQTATSDILRVISSSTTDVQPVFDEIVKSGLKLFPGSTVVVALPDDERVHIAAVATANDADEAAIRSVFPIALRREYMHAVAIMDRRVIDVPDAATNTDPSLPGVRSFLATGLRAATIVPMLRGDAAIGAISVIRRAPGPLTDKQMALLRTFADQAVIAIENVRLFKELQERTEALTKSVGQLTALGEVGQAISSTLDLEAVLKTIVQRAVQLAGLDGGSIYEFDERDEGFHLRAAERVEEEMLEVSRKSLIRLGEGAVGRAGATRGPVVVEDVLDPSYQSRVRELLIKSGSRAVLAVPLLREGLLLGALAVTRKSPGPFAPEVIELLKTFATQSAVAIQNARLFQEIAEKGKQLEVASQHKSQFLASMSHELRTPLNAILGFNEMMLDGLCGEVPAGFKDPLDEMQKSGKHLLRLINNVLDLAKIEAGRMELALADYSVHDTVESVRSTLRPLAAEKGLEFRANVPGDIPLAYGDAGRITQCLMNLAGNSLKFTKEGRVEISVQQQNGQLRYCVTDTGIGIPPEKIGSLFTEFKQTDATIASEYGGTGLGLSITKKFIEMHGGRIWVESEIGKGSAFTFEIPLKLGE